MGGGSSVRLLDAVLLAELESVLARQPGGLRTDPELWWHPGWLPIFGTGGLSKIALECSRGGETPSPLRQIDWDGSGATGYADAFARSLGEYVAGAVRCLSSGRSAYEAERDVWLPMDWADTTAGERFS